MNFIQEQLKLAVISEVFSKTRQKNSWLIFASLSPVMQKKTRKRKETLFDTNARPGVIFLMKSSRPAAFDVTIEDTILWVQICLSRSAGLDININHKIYHPKNCQFKSIYCCLPR